ncbi:type II secretion system F family protein [Isoptericola sp. b441]|uniref:Type II secretion system F family protein n=1 Tax=Actinotalea lenta TaxID=3064654 RepID=A0ABT9D6R6_9CELL|nr:type II secretion system F family protein [Isoptericola sp. b441]MDO8106533.1 type II secretion system F family protein [Isoptericola sp. b441]
MSRAHGLLPDGRSTSPRFLGRGLVRTGPRRSAGREFSELVVDVAAAVRSGADPSAAWAARGVRGQEVPRAADLARAGARPDAVAAVRAAGRLVARTGAPPAAVLDAVAASLEAEQDTDDRRRVALAGPTSSARLLAWLPALGLLLGVAVGADPFGVLVDGGAGSVLGLAGVLAALVGRAWSSRLVRAAGEGAREATDRGAWRGDRAARPASSVRAARGRGARTRLGRRLVAGETPEVPVAVLLELSAAVCAAGASVPGALEGVGRASGGRRGAAMAQAGQLLTSGLRWSQAWAGAPREVMVIADALRAAWGAGVAPGRSLRAAARRLRREQSVAANEAAGRLGVRLLLPLGLCHLPAFVMVGLVPVLVSLARGELGQ